MIGIVVVSHSPRLAEAAVDLALQMTPGERPQIRIAAGAGDDVIGTDAVRVQEAIDEVATPDGVLVFVDLGSAVMAAELAVELAATDAPVRITPAPFVEGMLAAVVTAAGGASLEAVAREAEGALAAKRGALPVADAAAAGAPAALVDHAEGGESVELRLVNRDGLHARPAAALIAALAGVDASVTATNLRSGAGPVALTGPTALLTLDARAGDTVRFTASGPDAAAALEVIRDLVEGGFGEPPADAAAPAPGAEPVAAPRGIPIGVSPGRAMAPVVRMPPPVAEPAAGTSSDPDADAAAIDAAAARVQSELRARAARVGADAAGILEAGALLVADPGVLEAAKQRVRGGSAPAAAVWAAFTDSIAQLTALGGRLAERAADLADARARLVAELLGLPAPGVPVRDEPFILVADELAPADAALLDPATCAGIVTARGGPTSHTAILARSLGIPAIVAAGAHADLSEGTIVLIDGATGEIDPHPAADALGAQIEVAPFDGHGRTRDGHDVPLYANVGGAEDAARGAAALAQGVGLFRTEFCFLGRQDAPTVAEQVDAYRPVFEAFAGRPVTVRTLDAGSDKPLAFVQHDQEQNPALGVRGLRIAWAQPQLLTDQLDAIAEAAAGASARVQVMAPMVATVEEAREFAALVRARGMRAGVMIETPAAALLGEAIVAEVDFVSVGTNDLAQYTMAADRLSGALAALNDPWQPAVLRLLGSIASAGAAAGVPVGVCGEAAADALLAPVLVGLGVTSLSMSPRMLAAVSASLGAVDLDECRRRAARALEAATVADARAASRPAAG